MSTRPSPLTAETLLRHEPFVRAVVRSLLVDESTTQDVLQETWLRTLRRSPRSKEALGAWLSRVARNLVKDTQREQNRRSFRERSASRPEQVEPVDVAYQRLSGQRRIVDSVLRLREPYKTVVVLRYYQGLSTDEIATHTRTSQGTVRSQLSRAHEILRRELDSEFGDRAAWASLTVPLSKSPPAAATSMLSAGVSLKLGIVAALLLGLAFIPLFQLSEATRADPSSNEVPPRHVVTRERSGPPLSLTQVTMSTREPVPTVADTPVQAAGPPEFAASTAQEQFESGLRVKVVTADEPMEGVQASLSLWEFPTPGSGAPPVLAGGREPVSSNIEGLLTLETRGMGGTRILFVAQWERGFGAIATIPKIQEVADLRLELQPLVEVHGTIRVTVPDGPAPPMAISLLDPDTRFPIATCRTESAFSFRIPPGRYEFFYARSDKDGTTRIGRGFHGPFFLHARETPLDLGPFEIDLPGLAEIRGRVVDANGAPLGNATVATLWIADSSWGDRMMPFAGVRTAADGTFVLREEVFSPPSPLLLVAYDADQERGVHHRVAPSEYKVPVELRLEPLGTVHGKLVLQGGKPPGFTNVYAYHKDGMRFASSRSQEGRLFFRLPPGRYVLRAYGTDTANVSIPVVIERGEERVDLGEIRLSGGLLSSLYGWPAPEWNVTAARGLEPSVTLSDFHGRWLLVEFWGFW